MAYDVQYRIHKDAPINPYPEPNQLLRKMFSSMYRKSNSVSLIPAPPHNYIMFDHFFLSYCCLQTSLIQDSDKQ